MRRNMWSISYPQDGVTKRESTGTRDRLAAEAILLKRRQEVEGVVRDHNGHPKVHGGDGGVRVYTSPSGDSPASTSAVPLPASIVSIALAVLEHAHAKQDRKVIELGLHLAAVVKHYQQEIGAL